MKILDMNKDVLFSGSKHDCKAYIRKHNVKRYTLSDTFVEKIAVVEEDVEETFFNKIFA